MTDRARSVFMTLKSKRQRTEDDKDDFHFVNKCFKRDGDLDNIQAGVTTLVAILDIKNEREPKATDKLRETQENFGMLMCTATGAKRILKQKCELIAQHLILCLMGSMRI